MSAIHTEQLNALTAFDQGRARFAHFIWHRRGRKTTMALNLILRECQRWKNKIYRFIAPIQTDARGIIWEDPNMLDMYLPDESLGLWKKNEGRMEVKFLKTNCLLKLEGADKVAEGKRGKRCDGVVLDEWAQHKAHDLLWNAVLRPMIAENPTIWAWFLTTPNGLNHAYDMYMKARDLYLSGNSETYTSLMTARTSTLISASELAKAKEDMPDAVFRQEFLCEWLAATEMVLIQAYELERLKGIRHGTTVEKRVISIDPAFTGDECILMYMNNTKVIDLVSLHPRVTGEIVGAASVMAARHDCKNFVVDSIGNGKGVYDDLCAFPEFNVRNFDSRRRVIIQPGDKHEFSNVRAKAWWYAWEEIKAGRVVYPEDQRIRAQVSQMRFRPVGQGALAMELKEDYKKRVKCSPDRGDAWIMGIDATRDVEPHGYNAPKTDHAPAAARSGAMAA